MKLCPALGADNRGIYFEGAGDYNYGQPVLDHAENLGGDGRFLKIELTGETQVGRVEIVHAAEPKQAKDAA